MQSMKGATSLLGSMNRQMNLPALQRIAMEFERENEIMDERQEMMDESIDEATGMEGEEEEGEDIVKEVLDEIGVDLSGAVRFPLTNQELMLTRRNRWAKHQTTYKRHPLAKPRLRRLLAVGQVRMIMTFKQGWIAFDDDYDDLVLYYISLLPEPVIR